MYKIDSKGGGRENAHNSGIFQHFFNPIFPLHSRDSSATLIFFTQLFTLNNNRYIIIQSFRHVQN